MRPSLIYGTAWKEDATESLVFGALSTGFRAIDTANQRKHYFEEAVGRGIARANIPRAQLWLQTKFTFRAGQDERLPYDPRASITDQVRQSYASSLAHLRTDYLDSYVLHGPTLRDGLAPADREAWAAIEATGARALGISNVSASQLVDLIAIAKIKPSFVQNRCYASRGWDRDVRAICAHHDIAYQGFSLLTANRDALHHQAFTAIARRYGRTIPQVVFRFAQQLGMIPLTGTTSPTHMREDLAISDFTLDPTELDQLASI